MAGATNKATSLTTLVLGTVRVPVGLFSTVAKPSKLADFDTAGPNGGVLKAQAIARAVPVGEDAQGPDQPVHSDPLADDPEPTTIEEALGREPHSMAGQPAAVDGQYGRELVEDGTGEVVLPQDVRRGVRLEDDRFIDCTEQLAKIDEDTRLDSIEIVAFVDMTQVPRAWVKGAMYVGAGDEQATHALRLIFEGLRQTRRGAVVKLTKRSRQSLGVITQAHGVLLLIELVWHEDFRLPPARATRIQKAKLHEREVLAMVKLIKAKSRPVEVLTSLRDDAIARREELRAQALRGEVPAVLAPEPPEDQDDVLAQLEASLAAVG